MTAVMSTLAARLRSADGGVALVPYLMAGHPDIETTRETGRRLAGLGVGAIELGVPYSDPLADGPVIQRAGQRALEAGADMACCLELAGDIAAGGSAPVVLMTYLNPVLAYGPRRFADNVAQLGVAGVIVPDAPVEEAAEIAGPLRTAGLDTAFLVAPTSSAERIGAACAASTGFVYCVTVAGTTGTRANLPTGVPELLAKGTGPDHPAGGGRFRHRPPGTHRGPARARRRRRCRQRDRRGDGRTT
jgi:tryptophan synthase alpha chain